MAEQEPMRKTSLSACEIIYDVLSNDEAITEKVTKIYPVVELTEAQCPYIVYRRTGLSANPQKAGQPGADTVEIEVGCFAADYEDSVELAELVRSALDYRQHVTDDLRMRSCYLSGASEDYGDDAFVQNLLFTIKI